jgi:hypothetical protein
MRIANGREAAENGPILLPFSARLRTGRKDHDCYTPQAFASTHDEFRTTYYYHYKKTRVGLKEESPWS